jgi:hypothetical protein
LGSVVKLLGKAVATFLPMPLGALADAATQVAAWQVRISDLTSQLQREQPSLLDLNHWYRTLRHVDTQSFYEVLIVDPLSADPGVYGCDPVRAEGKDHITISKPKDENDDLFKPLRQLPRMFANANGREKVIRSCKSGYEKVFATLNSRSTLMWVDLKKFQSRIAQRSSFGSETNFVNG